MKKSPQLLLLGRLRQRKWMELYGGSIWQAAVKVKPPSDLLSVWFYCKDKKRLQLLLCLALQIEDILEKRCGRAWVTSCTTSCWTTEHLISLQMSQMDKKSQDLWFSKITFIQDHYKRRSTVCIWMPAPPHTRRCTHTHTHRPVQCRSTISAYPVKGCNKVSK